MSELSNPSVLPALRRALPWGLLAFALPRLRISEAGAGRRQFRSTLCSWSSKSLPEVSILANPKTVWLSKPPRNQLFGRVKICCPQGNLLG